MINILRIATRKSPLAIWQAEFVKSNLVSLYPNLKIEIKGFSTTGDRFLDTSLAKIGGKGLFIKELETALKNNEADIAVHSMKDLPPQLPKEFVIAAVLERHDASDALVSNIYSDLNLMKPGALVGTSSARRQSQILAAFPDVNIKLLRGNVNTRIKRLDEGVFDAIVLATSGLERLGLGNRIAQRLPIEICLPSAGQGALGIECRKDDEFIELIKPLNHDLSEKCVNMEKEFVGLLNGSCSLPIGCYARLFDNNKSIKCEGFVGSLDGKVILRDEVTKVFDDSSNLSYQLYKKLIEAGAMELLEETNDN